MCKVPEGCYFRPIGFFRRGEMDENAKGGKRVKKERRLTGMA
jgi:hypothetical protein